MKPIVNPIRKTVRCYNCLAVFRMWQEGAQLVAGPAGTIKYCPICGATGPGKLSVGDDNELNYWEVLGEAYGYPVQIIQAIYESWSPDEYRRFGDYVVALQAELAQPAEQDAESVEPDAEAAATK